MTSTITIKLPDSIWQLSHYRSERLDELLSLLHSNEQVSGVLLGGSFSYKKDLTKSDVDLFCLINQVEFFESNLNNILSPIDKIDVIIFQGSFQWTEKLYTIYYKQDIDFSIDLCLINSENAETFFWEPDGYILFDKQDTIKLCRQKQMSDPRFTRQPFLKTNPFSIAVITLKKIDKNLSRGHLWNALEQLNLFRRYIMQIIRLNVIKHDYFLGRVDRDIEDVIPSEINMKLSQTTAIYDTKDIAHKAVLLIEILLALKEQLENSEEKVFQEWLLKQLKHDKNKLSTYFK